MILVRARSRLILAICLLLSQGLFAQLTDLDPDRKELEAKPPATFGTDNLVPIDMPGFLSVKLGLDPDSLTIASDGIVRYVVVAISNSGNINAVYEGIWCRTGEVKTYARAGNDRQWDAVSDPQWKKLSESQPSMHALTLARQGICNGRSASTQSTQAMLRRLKASVSDGVQR